MTAAVATERPCPECGSPVPVTTGYPDWCDRCGWNLQPPPASDLPQGRFQRLAEQAGRRSGERMVRELLAAHSPAARLASSGGAIPRGAMAVLRAGLKIGARAAWGCLATHREP